MKLDLDTLLELLDDLNPKVQGNNIVCNCPSCNHREFGVSIHKEGHLFGCYRKKKCGIVGGIYTLINLIGKPDFFKYGKEQTIIAEEELPSLSFGTVTDHEFHNLPTVELPYGYHEITEHPYLEGRNFARWQYKMHHPGMTEIMSRYANSYILFPVYQQGEVKGWVARCGLSKEKIKYRESIGLEVKRYDNGGTNKFGSLLYGLDEISEETHTLYLTEGIFSKYATDRAFKLYQTQEVKCLATFGSRITDDQRYLLSQTNVRNIKLLHEADVLKSTKKTLSLLQNHYDVSVAYLPEKDPDDMTEEELISLPFDTPTHYHNYLEDLEL